MIVRSLRGRPYELVEVAPPPKGLVESDHDQAPVGFDLGKSVFRGKKLLLSFQHFIVARFAGAITVVGHFYSGAVGIDGFSLLTASVFKLLARDQGVSNF